MPVSPLAPEISAVYAPGGRVTSMAESLLEGNFQGKAPTADADAEIRASPPQALLLAIRFAPELSISIGSGNVPVTPKGMSAGPEARIKTVLDVAPPMTKPAIRTFPPVPTWTRADMFTILGVLGEYVSFGVSS